MIMQKEQGIKKNASEVADEHTLMKVHHLLDSFHPYVFLVKSDINVFFVCSARLCV